MLSHLNSVIVMASLFIRKGLIPLFILLVAPQWVLLTPSFTIQDGGITLRLGALNRLSDLTAFLSSSGTGTSDETFNIGSNIQKFCLRCGLTALLLETFHPFFEMSFKEVHNLTSNLAKSVLFHSIVSSCDTTSLGFRLGMKKANYPGVASYQLVERPDGILRV